MKKWKRSQIKERKEPHGDKKKKKYLQQKDGLQPDLLIGVHLSHIDLISLSTLLQIADLVPYVRELELWDMCILCLGKVKIFSFKGKIRFFFSLHSIHTNPFPSQMEQKKNDTRT